MAPEKSNFPEEENYMEGGGGKAHKSKYVLLALSPTPQALPFPSGWA